MRLRKEFPWDDITKLTPGYVGADIQTLCKEASIIAVERIVTGNQYKNSKCCDNEDSDKDLLDLDNLFIEYQDFEKAAKRVQPSAQREGFSTVPNTTWNDVGALV